MELDNRLAKEFTFAPLKCTVAVLPFSLLLNFCPNHARTALAMGLGLGVVCAQLIPPRQSIRSALLWGTAAAIIGWLLPA
jgi:hypothetical protein